MNLEDRARQAYTPPPPLESLAEKAVRLFRLNGEDTLNEIAANWFERLNVTPVPVTIDYVGLSERYVYARGNLDESHVLAFFMVEGRQYRVRMSIGYDLCPLKIARVTKQLVPEISGEVEISCLAAGGYQRWTDASTLQQLGAALATERIGLQNKRS